MSTHFHLKRNLTAMLVTAAAAAAGLPAGAQAMPLRGDPPGLGQAQSAVALPAPSVAAPDSGFQWDDAAVGAAAVLVLVGAAAGAELTRRRRQERATVG